MPSAKKTNVVKIPSLAPKQVLVIPCYNEERRLQQRNYAFAANTAAPFHLLFVDDGSSDNTSLALRTISTGSQFLDPLLLERNVGKGEAVRQGMLSAIARGATFVGYMDADGSIPISEAERLLQHFSAEKDVIIGSRVKMIGYDIGRTFLRHYIGRVFATCASITLGQPVYDTQCGMKWFRVNDRLKKALAVPFHSRWAFDVELLGRLLKSNRTSRFEEVPIRNWKEIGGSKVRPWDLPVSLLQLLIIKLHLNRWGKR